MIQLDLLKLNKISPYKVFPSSRKGYYGFVSKSGVEFAIGFEFRRILGKAKAQANSLIIRTEFSSTRPVILDNSSSHEERLIQYSTLNIQINNYFHHLTS